MLSHRAATRFLPLMVPLALACGDGGSGPDGPVVDCDQTDPVQLAAGEFVTQDPSEVACVRIPAAGSAGAEYLYLAISGASTESNTGTSTPYRLVGSAEGQVPTAAVRSRPRVEAAARPTTVQRFHGRLRSLEHRLARQPHPARAAGTARLSAKVVPTFGDKRTFKVLKSADADGTSADDFVDVTGTVKHVGEKVVIYLDDASPTTGGYDQNDIDQIGSLFDDELYPIDTTAFGRESDVDGDGQVLVLLTDRVTRLAGCNNGQVVVGFFFALDLFEGEVGSNGAELFYGLTPDPACSVDKARAVELLPGVFIHEFQHMISFNQHVLVRNGSAEILWLNEGLSHYAEELGGRVFLQVGDSARFCDFVRGDLYNFGLYLANPGPYALVGAVGLGKLEERGAYWAFVRYVVDQFAADTTLAAAANFTRQLTQTSSTGTDNVVARTGVQFATLAKRWVFANWVSDLSVPGFTVPGNLKYKKWAFRSDFPTLHASCTGWSGFQRTPPDVFPLMAPGFPGAAINVTGTIYAGSPGTYQRALQGPGGGQFTLLFSDGTGALLKESVLPRLNVLRIR